MKAFFPFLLSAACFLGSPCAFSQPLGAGLKGGVPLTDFVNAASSNNLRYLAHTNRYLVGPFVELRLPAGLGIEFDALYRHFNYQAAGSSFSSNTTSNAWEFPLLLKYRLHGRIVRPFFDAGVAWDSLQGIQQTLSALTTSNSSTAAELRHKTVMGYVIGAGLDIHALVIHIQPEIRYTRWGDKHFLDVNQLLKSNQNQGEFMVGISF